MKNNENKTVAAMQGKVEEKLQNQKTGKDVMLIEPMTSDNMSLAKLTEKDEKSGIPVMADDALDKAGVHGLFIGLHVVHSITPANMSGYAIMSPLYGEDERLMIYPEYWETGMLKHSRYYTDGAVSIPFSISTHRFNVSSTDAVVYSMAAIGLREFSKNHTSEEMIEISNDFMTSFFNALADGKQKTDKVNSVPEMAYVTISQEMPLHMFPAFRNPIPDNGEGYIAPAVDNFCRYIKEIHDKWQLTPVKEFYAYNETREALGEKVRYEDMPAFLCYSLKSILSDTK